MWWSSGSSSRSIRKERREGGIVSCMSGMLQLFDFHLRGAIDCTGSSSSQVSAPSQLDDLALCCTAGIEAPRNSLEVLLPVANSGLLPQHRNRRHQLGHGDEIDDIPMAFEIFTRSESGRDWTYPDRRRKRSVVARLMGLDILPDNAENGQGMRRGGGEGRRKNCLPAKPAKDCSRGNGDVKFQRPKETKLKERNREIRLVERTVRQEPLPSCSRSLPGSPRISSARRSDVEHRLSLQIQKENIPPLVNVNNLDGSSLGSLLRASSSSALNSETRKTSPRLVLSSNSPRVGKTREEKGQPKLSSTPPCSPRLKCRGDQESTTITSTTTTISAAAATTTTPKPSLPRNKRTYPPQSTEPSSKANGPGSRLNNSINGKPKSEGPSLLRERSDTMARVQKKDRAPSPRIRESYVKVPDRSNGDAMKKGQRPICEHALLKAHSVIPATKDSPRQTRTSPASGISPLPRSRRKTVAAPGDIRQDGSVATDLCNNLHHHRHDDKEECMDPAPSYSCANPHIHDSPSSSSSSLSSFLSSSASTSTASSSGSSSSPFPKEKDEAFFLVYPYIRAIFELMGVRSNSKVWLLNWHSPSHPLNPAILTQLDVFHHRRHDDDDGSMDGRMSNTRSNRKLIFHLVDELLRERLKLHLGMAPWMKTMMTVVKSPAQGSSMKVATGRRLLEAVWADVRGIPSADCKIVHDVDMLVANDVLTGHHSCPINDSSTEAFAEAVLFRVGQDISDELVAEAVADFLPTAPRSNPQDPCGNMIR
ncbi:uncharacterized protein LOC116247264 isoform X2 [Nymphaea colorata]|uniref:uncharacterized protein LOC116247264 isoform X2 n=1 Tax=Nymphaea colorata TaxID=210225 RepID=UPI00129EAC59|nr:uncharacterized protein LOC116247264 isoform X2 [Nymphaea colorata]